MIENALFLGVGLKILFLLARKQSGLLDALLNLNPNGFHNINFSFKNPEILLFPNAPNEEARNEFPDSIEDGILKGMFVPVFDGVHDIVGTSVRPFTNTGYVGPEMICKWTLIENVLHVFLVNFAQRALRGTNESPSD